MNPATAPLVVLALISVVNVYAQDQILSVSTVKTIYEEGDPITISGNVNPVIFDTPVVLQLFFNNQLIEIRQITVANDGSFSESVIPTGNLWKNEGDYLVRAGYGEGNIAESIFSFKNKSPEAVDSFEVDAGTTGSFDIDYSIQGGVLENISVNPSNLGLNVSINPIDKGYVILSLPRNYIDAINQNKDTEYIVLVDGREVPYEELETNTESRTIKVNFDNGSREIAIIGTFVMPEFEIGLIVLIFGLVLALVLYNLIRKSKIMGGLVETQSK